MAVPGIPQNVNISQENVQVYLSWDLTSTATSYSVQRSANGVTYSVIGTSSLPNYVDTTCIVNTMYWYKVAAVNNDGTGTYSSAYQAVPTLPGKLSLYETRLTSKQRADRVNSKFVLDSEWDFFIRQADYELYDMIITAFEDYAIAPRLTFSTDGSQQYDLPNGANYSSAPALYKLYGVDLGLDTSQDAFVTLKKFNFSQRNQYVFPQLTSTYLGVFNLRYRMLGDKIMFIPSPAGGQTIGLWYYPRRPQLLKDTDVFDGVSGWTQYVIVRAAKYALDKEESDTSKLDAELLFLKDRIESALQSRDAGQPDSISDIRTRASLWGGYGDGPFGGI